MDKIEKYEFLARLEVEKKVRLIPTHNGSKESILDVLDLTIETVVALDKELIKLSSDYILQNRLTEEEAWAIKEINAASLAALLVKSNIPGEY